jgi:hypothetical protein
MNQRVPRDIKKALQATGMPWTIKIGGRLVGILPLGNIPDADKRPILNLITQIQRTAHALREQKKDPA